MDDLVSLPDEILRRVVERLADPVQPVFTPNANAAAYSHQLEDVLALVTSNKLLYRACISNKTALSVRWKELSDSSVRGTQRAILIEYLQTTAPALRSLILHSPLTFSVCFGPRLARIQALNNLRELEISLFFHGEELLIKMLGCDPFGSRSWNRPYVQMPLLQSLTVESVIETESYTPDSVLNAILGDAAHGGEPRFPRLKRVSLHALCYSKLTSIRNFLGNEVGKRLTHLRLEHDSFEKVNPEIMFDLVATKCESLDSLELRGFIEKAGSNDFRRLLMSGISTLSLQYTVLKASTLAEMLAGQHLKHLEICLCKRITRRMIVSAVTGAQFGAGGLETLILTHCHDIRDEDFSLICGVGRRRPVACALKRLAVAISGQSGALTRKGFTSIIDAKRVECKKFEIRLVDNPWDFQGAPSHSPFGHHSCGMLNKPSGVEHIMSLTKEEMSRDGRTLLVSNG